MYQNPLMRSFQGPRDGSRPESVGAEVIRPSGDSVASGDMTKGPAQALPQGYRNRREAAFANAARRRNPLMAKPIRYDDPKGGYQQPGTRSGEVMRNTNPLAGNDSIRYSPANEMTPPEDMTRSMQSAVSTLQNSPGIQAILERRRQSRMA